MSGNNRQITRRPPQTAPGAPHGTGVGTSPAKIEALRKLVASGQYQVSPRWIATKIFRAAGVKLPE